MASQADLLSSAVDAGTCTSRPHWRSFAGRRSCGGEVDLRQLSNAAYDKRACTPPQATGLRFYTPRTAAPSL